MSGEGDMICGTLGGGRGNRDIGSVKTKISFSTKYSFLAAMNAMMMRVLHSF